MPFTSAKGFSVQSSGTNAGTWGQDSTTPTANSSNALNEGVIELLDQQLGQTTTLSLSSSTPVLLTQIQTQKGMLRITGTLLANIVLSPDAGVLMTGFYCWENVTSGSFTVTVTNSAGSVVLPQSRRGLMWIDTTNGPRIISIAGSGSADPIPVGTPMLFYQSAAPTGWTISGALDDYALRLVSSGGGSASGSVPYSTLFARTATDSHTLTTSQIPSHTHGWGIASNFNQGGGALTNQYVPGANEVTQPTGGGNGHTHNIDMRVRTATVILATKN